MLNLQTINRAVPALLTQASDALILPRFRALGADEVQAKTHANDLVTVADIEAEAWLSPRLCDLIPGSVSLGEEAASRGEVTAAVLDGNAPVWTIDPVDGTYNFVQGSEDFCAMVGLIIAGQVVGGWIYFPTKGIHFHALKGEGAYREIKGGQQSRLNLDTIKTDDLPATVSHRFWKREALKAKRSEVMEALKPTAPTSCAGLNYCDVAAGKTAFVAMATLTPWDHAPGTLIASEAGCDVLLNGGTYDPSVDRGALISGKPSARRYLAERHLKHFAPRLNHVKQF